MSIRSQTNSLLAVLREHADEKGRVALTPPDLVNLAGFNLHDVNKRLWSLQKQGLVRFREVHRSGSSTGSTLHDIEVVIDQPDRNAPVAKRATQTERVLSWLERQPTNAEGWVQTDTGMIAMAVGLTTPQVSVVVNQLRHRKILETLTDGHAANAFRLMHKRPGLPYRAIGAPVMPETPALEEYLLAKSMAPRMSRYLTFNEDPIAEEAIALRDNLRRALEKK